MKIEEKLDKLIEKHQELSDKLMSPGDMNSQQLQKLSKEHAALDGVVELAKRFQALQASQNDLQEMLKDASSEPGLKDMVEAEIADNKRELESLTHQIKIALLPKDKDDDRGAILEVRAGAGGDEASLFAAELFHMYQKYAEKRRWKFEIISLTETGLDGYKEAIASISGHGVFARLKLESGVHRVQRVPATESSGRIHTSTVTVAVLPEAEEVDIVIDEKDLRIDVFRSSGSGGQHVNTTDSAVRITHLPTNTVVSQQSEKSQHANKKKGMQILRARLYERERMKLQSERSNMRKGQVGTGERSEKIRTYNFPQSRVTDHRINFTSHQLAYVLGEGDLDDFINSLIANEQAQLLSQEMEE
jgi:peptide chain release factor 1